MIVEINEDYVSDLEKEGRALEDQGMLLTPVIGDESYWLFRVKLSEDQAIIAFPKFGIIGIGFQQEEDWNTNLPSTQNAEELFQHIEHNKGDASISDEDCIKAIKMIQEAIKNTQQ